MKYYAVKVGLKAPLITTSWDECSTLVKGYSGALYKSFNKIEDALVYLEISDKAQISLLVSQLSQVTNHKTEELKESKEIKEPKEKNKYVDTNTILNGETHKALLKKQLSIKTTTLDNLIVFTDGSCLNQGDPDRSLWKAGSGIFLPNLGLNIGLKLDKQNQTNNRAELYPIVWILELLYDVIMGNTQSIVKKIEIHSDSNYAITNLNSKNLKNLDLWKSLKNILSQFVHINIDVVFVKEPAHSGIYGNEMADQIADFMAQQQ